MLDAGCWMLDTMNNYRDLEIWKLARRLSIDLHQMSLARLPKFELYEEGSQIRRSSKSIRSNIAEGFGRRRYKADFVRFLTYALASSDETVDHLDCLAETGSLTDQDLYSRLREQCDELGRKLNRFLQAVETGHRT